MSGAAVKKGQVAESPNRPAPESGPGAFEVMLKTFGPSVFVVYFFTLGYLRSLKIPVAPSLNEALAFFVSSVLPSSISDLVINIPGFVQASWGYWLQNFAVAGILVGLPELSAQVLRLKKIPERLRSPGLAATQELGGIRKSLLEAVAIWIPGILLFWCIVDLHYSGDFQLFWRLEMGRAVPVTRMTFTWAILLSLLWGPYSLFVSDRLRIGRSHSWKLGLVFLLMCSSSYYLAFEYAGIFTSGSRVRIKNDELRQSRIVWGSGDAFYLVSCPENGEWVVSLYESGKEVFSNNLSRDKHSGICR